MTVILAGCSTSVAGTSLSEATSLAAGVAGTPLPPEASHVHGAVLGPDATSVLVATHTGLYQATGDTVTRVSPAIDLMGFAQAPDGELLASGHPDPATGLPAPAGLITSTDGGRTWRYGSRGGQSDFHALTAAGQGAVGYDGALRLTTNRRTWTLGDIPVPPFALASDDTGHVILATTEKGLHRSSDGARTFAPVTGAPLLLLVANTRGTSFVGVAPGGQVWASSDGGLTWDRRGQVTGATQALAANDDRVVVVADHRIVTSQDAGSTFTALAKP